MSVSLIDELISKIIDRNKLQAAFLELSLGGLTDEDRASLEKYLQYCIDSGWSLDFIALSYDTVVRDHLREQIYFQRHGHYRYSTYDEVAASVYDNPDYMGRYMHGLAITNYLWPNHLQMRRFFLETLPREKTGRYLEVGPGHGLFITAAMQIGAFSEYIGVDISDTSIAITRSILEHPLFGPCKDYRLEHRDFLANSFDGSFDAIVMGEVLEHVEKPEQFLAQARSLAPPGGYVFVTTAVNGPVIDHLYLFRTVGEVEQLIVDAGFEISARLVIPHVGTSLAESEQRRLPVSVAYAVT